MTLSTRAVPTALRTYHPRLAAVTVGMLLGLASPHAAVAAVYGGTLTGVASHDGAGGTGAYHPPYSLETQGGVNRYLFAAGDHIDVESAAAGDIAAVGVFGADGALPVQAIVGALDDRLFVSATRGPVGTWGVAFGANVDHGSTEIFGDFDVQTRSDDFDSAAIGIRVNQAAFKVYGATRIETFTPGYSQGMWAYQGNLLLDGNVHILARAQRASTSGIYNSGGGVGLIDIRGDATIDALGVWPSDNVHGIYNDNVNTRLNIAGTLNLIAVSNGSTVFGIRNQGNLGIDGEGDHAIIARGPRSARGVANTHHSAKLTFRGNVAISVTNGTDYTPFDLPTGIQNNYPGSGWMHYWKGVDVSVTAATTAFGIDNRSAIDVYSSEHSVPISVSTRCASCNVFGVRNLGGRISIAGGVEVQTHAGTSGRGYALWNVPLDGRDATIKINDTGARRVRLEGDIVSGTVETVVANTTVALPTADSYFHGDVASPPDDPAGTAGNTWLTLTNGAQWLPRAATQQLGAGRLRVADGAIIDLSQAREGEIVMAGTQAAVSFGTDAQLGLSSNVLAIEDAAWASKLVLSAGVTSIDAPLPLRIAILNDPLLDSGQIANVAGWTTYLAATPLVIVDGVQAGGDGWAFVMPQPVVRSTTAIIGGEPTPLSTRPELGLSADGRQIVLRGISVHIPAIAIFDDGFESR